MPFYGAKIVEFLLCSDSHHGDGVVPSVGGDGKVEGGDDPDDAERVPALEQRVAWALAMRKRSHMTLIFDLEILRDQSYDLNLYQPGYDAAGQHAGQPDGVVADVDVLLHLADALGQDLAHLQAHQLPQGLQLVPAEVQRRV